MLICSQQRTNPSLPFRGFYPPEYYRVQNPKNSTDNFPLFFSGALLKHDRLYKQNEYHPSQYLKNQITSGKNSENLNINNAKNLAYCTQVLMQISISRPSQVHKYMHKSVWKVYLDCRLSAPYVWKLLQKDWLHAELCHLHWSLLAQVQHCANNQSHLRYSSLDVEFGAEVKHTEALPLIPQTGVPAEFNTWLQKEELSSSPSASGISYEAATNSWKAVRNRCNFLIIKIHDKNKPT